MGVVKSSAKLMVRAAVVSVNTTLVLALTSPLNVAPLLCTKVNVFKGVTKPTVLATFNAPVAVASMVSDWASAVEPSTAPPNVNAAPPVVNHAWSVNVMAVPASPRLITPAPLVLICPAMLMWLGAVAVKPPVKINVSVAASPKVKVPVLLNTVLAATAVLAPSNFKLNALPDVLRSGVVRLATNVTSRVALVSLNTTLVLALTSPVNVAPLL